MYDREYEYKNNADKLLALNNGGFLIENGICTLCGEAYTIKDCRQNVEKYHFCPCGR